MKKIKSIIKVINDFSDKIFMWWLLIVGGAMAAAVAAWFGWAASQA